MCQFSLLEGFPGFFPRHCLLLLSFWCSLPLFSAYVALGSGRSCVLSLCPFSLTSSSISNSLNLIHKLPRFICLAQTTLMKSKLTYAQLASGTLFIIQQEFQTYRLQGELILTSLVPLAPCFHICCSFRPQNGSCPFSSGSAHTGFLSDTPSLLHRISPSSVLPTTSVIPGSVNFT